MDEVQFDEQRPTASARPMAKHKGLIGLLIRQGYARDAKGAQKILLGILAVTVVATIAVNMVGTTDVPAGEPQPLPETLIR